MLVASFASSSLRIISYSSWMFLSLYFSLVGSEPLTTWLAGARVTSNTRSLYNVENAVVCQDLVVQIDSIFVAVNFVEFFFGVDA